MEKTPPHLCQERKRRWVQGTTSVNVGSSKKKKFYLNILNHEVKGKVISWEEELHRRMEQENESERKVNKK